MLIITFAQQSPAAMLIIRGYYAMMHSEKTDSNIEDDQENKETIDVICS